MSAPRNAAWRCGIALLLGGGVLLAVAGVGRPRVPGSPTVRAPAGRPPGRPALQAGESLRYALSLNDVTAGTLEVRLRAGAAGTLAFEYSLRPVGSVAALLRYSVEGSTILDPRTLEARRSRVVKRTRRGTKTTTVRFDPATGHALLEVQESGEDEIDREELSVESCLDVPAALLLLRTVLPQELPRRFQVLNGDDLYEVAVRGVAHEPVRVPAGSFGADAVRLAARELEEGEPPGEEHALTVWVARSSGVPVKLRTKLLLGRLEALLLERSEGEAAGAPGP